MTLLREVVGDEKFERMLADPSVFVEAFDSRELWDFQRDILQQATERDTEGIFVKPICVISTPRQNSKSTISGWLGSWRLFTDDTVEEIVVVANDRAQATIILRDIRRLIQRSGALFSCIDESWGLTKTEIRLKDGRRLIVKSSDAVSSRGLRPGQLQMDETGWTADRSLFDTLSAGMAASPNPLTIITSTVGPAKRGILWELFELAEAGDPAVRLIYYTENLSPKVSRGFLDRRRCCRPGSTTGSTAISGANLANRLSRRPIGNARLKMATPEGLTTLARHLAIWIWDGAKTNPCWQFPRSRMGRLQSWPWKPGRAHRRIR